MKGLVLLLLVSLQAQALNRTFLGMPDNRAYMNFVLNKYLTWHRGHFKFPEESPLLTALVASLDNWVISDVHLRQLSMGHYARKDGSVGYRLRVYVAPEHRKNPALRGAGLPQQEPSFVEWDSQGGFCQLYQEKLVLTAWCRNKLGKFERTAEEEIGRTLPEGWTPPFPVLGEKIIITKTPTVEKIMYFESSPHASVIPRALMRSVYLHTKDALFPLDRVAVDREGNWTIYYP